MHTKNPLSTTTTIIDQVQMKVLARGIGVEHMYNESRSVTGLKYNNYILMTFNLSPNVCVEVANPSRNCRSRCTAEAVLSTVPPNLGLRCCSERHSKINVHLKNNTHLSHRIYRSHPTTERDTKAGTVAHDRVAGMTPELFRFI